MSGPLTDEQLARWALWKQATDVVMRQVAQEIAAVTGLSSADFSVLTRLVEEGGGALRQQRLADDLRWQRSRLSRHLGRMEARGLITREGTGPQRWIAATRTARRLVVEARVAHADAVRRHLLDVIPSQDADLFWTLIEAVAGPGVRLEQTRIDTPGGIH
ncbi:MarR family winged helix-turn-helix transcriptional regulator [Microbispora sp. NPDC049125]|uniref:MarR family winged helix-turn-helix transcriptional regulator n=1 Tax=Microbispora sp. NPDC049125 TaxID=3154929 RepID=UPI0034668EAE